MVGIGLILLIPLFFVFQSQSNSQAANNAPTPYVTFTPGPRGIAPGGIPVTPAPPTPFVITGIKPPACTFPLAQTTTTDPALANYSFSAPKAVPIKSSWRDISLFQWLPDDQRVLIGHSDDVQLKDLRQTLGLLNPQTGESQDLASRYAPSSARPPVWIPSLNAVVYAESQSLTPFTVGNNGQALSPDSADFQRRLWLSRGDPTHIQTIIDERVAVNYKGPSKFGEQFTLAASSDGNTIVYLDSVGRQLRQQKVVQGSFQSVTSPSFDATQWFYRPGDPTLQIGWYATWRPNSAQVLLYSRPEVFGDSYTFLVDVQSGIVCELNLWTDDPKDVRQSWAPIAHWSPNGRYLTVVRARGQLPIDYSDLIVLDSAIGKLYQIEPTRFSPAGLEKQGEHFVSHFAWAPDNRHLAVIGRINYWPSGNAEMQFANKLFLLDILTSQSVQVSSAELAPNMEWPNDDLLWSNDGSQLVVIGYPAGLYLLSVQKQVQP